MAAKKIDPRNKYARLLLELESLNYEIAYSKDAKTVSRVFIVEEEEYLGIGMVTSEFKEQLRDQRYLLIN